MTRSVSYRPQLHTQRGVVLVVTLIMLGIFTVIVVGMVTTSNINFKVAGNQQYRLEAKSAARNAVEAYISNAANFQLPLPTVSTEMASDFNGDGTVDMTATVAPPDCIRSVPIMMAELDVTDEDDAQCYGTTQNANPGILNSGAIASTGSSWCSRMNWDVAAVVADTTTGASIEMHQGVYLRTLIGTPCLN
jgi:Tfp pilus assembly protein PilX